MLAAFVVAGSYGTPMLLAHALGASSIRVAVFIDDGRREPPSTYYLSVKFWDVCVRVEWIGARDTRDRATRS